MAQYVRHDRDRHGSVPLRRVVRQRPLTEDELAAMYGQASPQSAPLPEPEPYSELPYSEQPPSVSPPGVVRPAEWTDDVAGDARQVGPYYQGPYYQGPGYEYQPVPSEQLPASVPPPSPWVPREHWAPREVYADEEPVALPMRRSRIGSAIVVLVLLAAAGLLGYALVASNVFDRVTFGTPKLATEASEPIERTPIDVGAIWTVFPARSEASVTPSRQATTPEPQPAPERQPRAAPARAQRPEPNRTYTYQRPEQPAPAPPPAANPYPDVQGDRSLDRLQQEVESGIAPEPQAPLPPPPEPKPEPEAEPEPPADLKMPDEYRQPKADVPGF